jgi:hypothetical protein
VLRAPPDAPAHIGGLAIYDRSTASGSVVRLRDILRTLENHLRLARTYGSRPSLPDQRSRATCRQEWRPDHDPSPPELMFRAWLMTDYGRFVPTAIAGATARLYTRVGLRMVSSSRINVAGISRTNAGYVADALAVLLAS